MRLMVKICKDVSIERVIVCSAWEVNENMPKPNLMISRKSVAAFTVDALEEKSLIGKLPVLSAI